MNLARIMIPKVSTVFLKENQSVRQGWEIMNRNGYTAIPVLDTDGKYIGTVSEGDFLKFIMPELLILKIWKAIGSDAASLTGSAAWVSLCLY